MYPLINNHWAWIRMHAIKFNGTSKLLLHLPKLMIKFKMPDLINSKRRMESFGMTKGFFFNKLWLTSVYSEWNRILNEKSVGRGWFSVLGMVLGNFKKGPLQEASDYIIQVLKTDIFASLQKAFINSLESYGLILWDGCTFWRFKNSLQSLEEPGYCVRLKAGWLASE